MHQTLRQNAAVTWWSGVFVRRLDALSCPEIGLHIK